MNRLGGRSAWETVALTVAAWCLLTGLNSWAEAAPTVTLEQSVHFTASDGSDVVAETGTYQVDASDSHLTLSMEGCALLLDAKPTTHSEKIDSPLAVMVSGEDLSAARFHNGSRLRGRPLASDSNHVSDQSHHHPVGEWSYDSTRDGNPIGKSCNECDSGGIGVGGECQETWTRIP